MNNRISSYKISDKETWFFYDDPNFENLLFQAEGPFDWTSVPPEYNDKISSVGYVRPISK